MVDKISLKRIELLHPYVRETMYKEFLEASELVPSNYMLRITQGLRTIKEQDDLYAQGRTKLFDVNGKRLGIVTWARGGESYHNYGLAFDFCLLRDMDNNGTFETVDWNEKTHSKKIVAYFKSKGWQWGGDFPKGKEDYPHFQKTFGYKVSQLYAKSQTGKFIEGTKYVTL
jgi:peptidoglycan LD-endopeptidase CwlK